MPTRQAILVATGADRPGVLDDVSLFLHDRHVAILESRVSLLRGQFGLLLLIRAADDDAMATFEKSLPELDRSAGINTEIRPATDAAAPDATPLRLNASGDDPGAAVFRLSHLMRVLNVNIENIETSSATPQTSGTRAGGFTLEMELSVPRATPVMMLKQYVQALADELKIQCDVKIL